MTKLFCDFCGNEVGTDKHHGKIVIIARKIMCWDCFNSALVIPSTKRGKGNRLRDVLADPQDPRVGRQMAREGYYFSLWKILLLIFSWQRLKYRWGQLRLGLWIPWRIATGKNNVAKGSKKGY